MKFFPQALAIFFSVFLIYFIFSNQKSAIYNHHVYLADAFLKGAVEIKNPPSWHNDVAHFKGKIYSIYAPMPAILLLPLVVFQGLAANEALLNLFLGALGVTLFFLILKKLKFTTSFSLWLVSLYAFGTLHFFSSVHDQTWWYAYVVVELFFLLIIYEILGKKRPFLIGLFIGAAYLTRLETIFILPLVLIILNWGKISWQKTLSLLLGILPGFLTHSYYNFIRFGNIFETGYSIFVRSDPSSVIPYGLFSLKYFPFNFKTYFLTGPEIISKFPYLKPSWMGMSIFLVTPALLYILKAMKKEPLIIGAWLTVILMAIPSLTYFLPGWTEFGWKHSVMFTPLLMLLIARGMNGKLNFLGKILIILSIIVNFWGVLWWKLAGWFY